MVGDRGVQLVITSPPYLGTYDYLAHQARRATILGIGTARAAAAEIGSRRAATEPEEAILRWREDLAAVLAEMERVLVPRGHALLLIGTSRVGEELVHSDAILEELAPRAGLEVVAVASQDRPDRGPSGTASQSTRPEHLVWLRPSAGAPSGEGRRERRLPRASSGEPTRRTVGAGNEERIEQTRPRRDGGAGRSEHRGSREGDTHGARRPEDRGRGPGRSNPRR
jgi:hypothetical protein